MQPALTSGATGFFHTDHADGRWWIIDPQGQVAAHHVGYGEDSLGRLVEQINQVIVAEQQRRKAAAPTAG